MDEITVFILNESREERAIQIPLGINMSLMEALKAYEEPIVATCGGMALCATCHVEVVGGYNLTGDLTEDEEVMLDTLPVITQRSRLSCQVKINEKLHGLRIRYVEGVLA